MDLDPTLLDLDSEVGAKIMFGLDHRQHITIIQDTDRIIQDTDLAEGEGDQHVGRCALHFY